MPTQSCDCRRCRLDCTISVHLSDDPELRARLNTPEGERRRFGYRRLHIMLKREDTALNHKKLFRLYREERLTVHVR